MASKFILIAATIAFANAGILSGPAALSTYSAPQISYPASLVARSENPLVSTYASHAPVVAAYSPPAISRSVVSSYTNHASPITYTAPAYSTYAAPAVSAYAAPVAYSAPAQYSYSTPSQYAYSAPAQYAYSAPASVAYAAPAAVASYSSVSPLAYSSPVAAW